MQIRYSRVRKGKVIRETDDPPTQSLTRKSSFWSRKKKNALPATLPVTNDRTVMPSLPLGRCLTTFGCRSRERARSIAVHMNHDLPHSATLSRSFSRKQRPYMRLVPPQQLITSISKEVPKGKRSPRSPKATIGQPQPTLLPSFLLVWSHSVPPLPMPRPEILSASSLSILHSPRPDPPLHATSITIPHHSAPPEKFIIIYRQPNVGLALKLTPRFSIDYLPIYSHLDLRQQPKPAVFLDLICSRPLHQVQIIHHVRP